MLPIEISFSVEHVEYNEVAVMSLFMMCRKKGSSLDGADLDSFLCPDHQHQVAEGTFLNVTITITSILFYLNPEEGSIRFLQNVSNTAYCCTVKKNQT